MTETNVLEINDVALDHMLNNNPDKQIFVLFYTPTCLPCREIIKVIDRASLKYLNMIFVRINTSVTDNVTDKKYSIRCHPTSKIFTNGLVLGTYEGCPATLDLDPFIEKHYRK